MKLHGPILLGLAFFLLAVSTAAATPSICDNIVGNLVQNCGFELPYPGAGVVPTDWSGSNFTVYESVVSNLVNSGSQSMRIANFERQGAAILWQSFADTPGGIYTFDFYLLNGDPGGSPEQFQVFWGTSANPMSGAPIFEDTGSASDSWTLHSFTVTGTGSDTITFTSYSDPSYYYLDDVSLAGGGAVPEPATFVLLAMGLAGLAVCRRSARGDRR